MTPSRRRPCGPRSTIVLGSGYRSRHDIARSRKGRRNRAHGLGRHCRAAGQLADRRRTSTESATPTTGATTTTSPATTTPAGGSSPAPPSITDLSPSSGSSGGGTQVTITGTGFQSGHTSITIDGTTVPTGSVTVNTPTQLTFRTPAHAAGLASLTASTANGVSNRLTYTYTDIHTDTSTAGLASTGVPTEPIIELAALLLLIGSGIVLTARKPTIGRHRR